MKIELHLPSSLHKRAAELAAEDSIPLAQLITLALAEKISALDASTYIQQRASRADRSAMKRVLDSVPSVPPMPGDELPPEMVERLRKDELKL